VRRPSRSFRRSAEAGYPALTIDGLVGLFGPTGMPLELRQRITADIRAIADRDHRGPADHHRPAHEYRRPGRIRQIDRRAARHDRAFARDLGIKPMQ
jgi:hypothetical protein